MAVTISPSAVTPVPTPAGAGVDGAGVVGFTPTCLAHAASICHQHANVGRMRAVVDGMDERLEVGDDDPWPIRVCLHSS
jgi:hypothetical protein